jgi:hypothetical protein
MKDIIKAVNELHEQGLSYGQIANELGITKSKAYRIINDGTNVSENETIHETSDSETFRNERNISKKGVVDTEKEVDNLKLKVKLKKMELKHEEKMRLLEMEEQEKRREYELEQNELINENLKLKAELKELQQKSDESYEMDESDETDDDYIQEPEEDDIGEDYEDIEPELDVDIVQEVRALLNEFMNQEKYSIDDLENYLTSISNLKTEILDFAEPMNMDEDDVFEYRSLRKIETVIEDYIENFEEYKPLFGNKINLVLESGLYHEIEHFVNNHFIK